MGGGQAVRYPVGVGKPGKQWAGTTIISGKYRNPDWAPPAEVKHDVPHIPDLIRGGTPGNPMGVAAMTLFGGQYAFTAPTGRTRSAASSLMAVCGCTIRTSAICSSASRLVRLWL